MVRHGEGRGLDALVVGCGSAGRRHVANLCRHTEVAGVSIYTGVEKCLDLFEERGKLRVAGPLEDVEADFAIIANETERHMDTALLLAERGMNLFIEKPISHTLDGTAKLKAIAGKKGLKIFVGYNMRFLGAMEYFKNQVATGVVGTPYFAKIEAGQYLPSWRPAVDYRTSYSAKLERGGGVALDLSHELDYMRYLFGGPSSWKVTKRRVSELELDCEDVFEGVFEYKNGFVCNVHLDYLQHEKRRTLRLVGSRGTIECDFVNKEIRIRKVPAGDKIKGLRADEVRVGDYAMFDMERTYFDELAHFIEAIKKDTETGITLDDGVNALMLLEDGHA